MPLHTQSPPPSHHAGQHAAKAPHVQGVVILLVVHKQLWALEVARRHTHVVLLARVVELCQTPVNETKLEGGRQGGSGLRRGSVFELLSYFSVLVVDHDVVWLDVSVHDAHAVAVVEGFEQLVQVEPDVVVRQVLVQCLNRAHND